ncbi:type II toxin-antitoxin system RelE/ParE family toxin [Hydrogenimonas sp. SS33]|uniref:type II toxin-antitoxin system RelE/ParE family toxin n=1 Tax=Hydrogenimonas leucolamina TaxID=2954236 RepID=UPI00336BF9D9
MPAESEFDAVFTKKAASRLAEAAAFVYEESGNPEVADRVLNDLKTCIVRMLGTFPRLGRPAPEFGHGIRKLVCRKFTVLYRIKKGKVIVMTLFRENLP